MRGCKSDWYALYDVLFWLVVLLLALSVKLAMGAEPAAARAERSFTVAAGRARVEADLRATPEAVGDALGVEVTALGGGRYRAEKATPMGALVVELAASEEAIAGGTVFRARLVRAQGVRVSAYAHAVTLRDAPGGGTAVTVVASATVDDARVEPVHVQLVLAASLEGAQFEFARRWGGK